MTEQVAAAQAGTLTGGDWVMAIISFFLTPIVSAALAIYSFAKGRKPQGTLYLGVLAAQFALLVWRFGLLG